MKAEKVLNATAQKLLKSLENFQARIGIIGQGYVGLPLAVAFAKRGFRVSGIDLDRRKIESLRKGKSYIEDVPSRDVEELVSKKLFSPTDDFDVLAKLDVVIICVPTPLNRVRDPDLSFITKAADSIRERLHKGQLIILESTTYPGTTEEIILPNLERSGLSVERDFFLCFSPERIDPGNKKFPIHKIPKVVGGINPVSTRLGAALYSNISEQVVPVTSSRTAEMAKLLENTFRIVNIGLVNELAKIANVLKINIWEAIDAASTKPFGFMPFYPGPGIGGHCIGVDPIYLSWKARTQGADVRFIELARRVNEEMPRFVIDKAMHILNTRTHKAMSLSKILILGVSYKRDVSDTRESPALEIIHGLEELGAKVNYHDPFVPQIKNETIHLKSLPLKVKNLKAADLVIVVTDHTSLDYDYIAKNARVIFDTRNVKWSEKYNGKLIKL